MSGPFFSVLVTAYNRAEEVVRCVRSCSEQSFEDFEIVVVDDASTDATPAVLAAIEEPRLRVVRHERNRGISPARATAARNASGEWMVVLDSDWELVPGSLARLREVIAELPPQVRMIRSRLRGDDGELQPGVLPAEGITDYDGRLRWCDAVAAAEVASDAGHCIHRSVLEAHPFIDDHRGVIETLWELDVARTEPSLWLPDVLGLQHAGSPNSHTRDVDPRRLVPRLLQEAPDHLWAVERLIAGHDAEMARLAPRYRLDVLESGVMEALLAGRRRQAIGYAVSAMRSASWARPKLWTTLALGLLDGRVLAWTKALGRQWRAAMRRVGTAPANSAARRTQGG